MTAYEIDAGISQTLFYVDSVADGRALVKSGIKRGRIWTKDEVEKLRATPEMTKELAREIAETKLMFEGQVLETGKPSEQLELLGMEPRRKRRD